MSERTVAILVAAGHSTRMGSEMPKPYISLGKESLLRYTVKAFLGHPKIDGIRVVIRREHHAYYKKATEGLNLFPCVIGGATRQESVWHGLESLAHRKPKNVLIHDIARPMVSPALITRVVEALDSYKGVVPALPITDTVKRAKDAKITETIDREYLYAIQTPQGFNYETLLDCHRKQKGAALSDDATLFEKDGIPVAVVDGDAANIKITTPEDITHMQTLLSTHSEIRTGMGYDVHTLKVHDPDTPVSQQHIKLCGVKIPFSHYLEGHSDADVGLHALVDAMLGAIAAGDIGTHFPQDDRKWQGADSERFLLYAYEMIRNKGGEVVHLDVTLICERPKIATHRDHMRDHIAQVLKMPRDCISVKATTTERLGFIGRGEGIAAQAVATVRLPK